MIIVKINHLTGSFVRDNISFEWYNHSQNQIAAYLGPLFCWSIMPYSSSYPCQYPHCLHLSVSHSGYCDLHKKQNARILDTTRGSPTDRGYDYRWQKIRRIYLADHPLCYDCQLEGRVTAAYDVHHVRAIRDGGDHRDSNLMALCHECHSRRTLEDSVRPGR